MDVGELRRQRIGNSRANVFVHYHRLFMAMRSIRPRVALLNAGAWRTMDDDAEVDGDAVVGGSAVSHGDGNLLGFVATLVRWLIRRPHRGRDVQGLAFR